MALGSGYALCEDDVVRAFVDALMKTPGRSKSTSWVVDGSRQRVTSTNTYDAANGRHGESPYASN